MLVVWSGGPVLMLFDRSTGAREHRSKLFDLNKFNITYFNIRI